MAAGTSLASDSSSFQLGQQRDPSYELHLENSPDSHLEIEAVFGPSPGESVKYMTPPPEAETSSHLGIASMPIGSRCVMFSPNQIIILCQWRFHLQKDEVHSGLFLA